MSFTQKQKLNVGKNAHYKNFSGISFGKNKIPCCDGCDKRCQLDCTPLGQHSVYIFPKIGDKVIMDYIPRNGKGVAFTGTSMRARILSEFERENFIALARHIASLCDNYKTK